MPTEIARGVYVPTFAVEVNDKSLPDEMAKSIVSLTVTQLPDEPSNFSIRLSDRTLEFIDRDKGTLVEGAPVKISMGYVGELQPMLVGEITSVQASFPASGPVELEVDGFDMLHRLTRGEISREFPEDQSHADIVKSIAAEVGLTADGSVDPTDPRDQVTTQNGTTNLDFINELARANNYSVWIEDTTLHFQAQRSQDDSVALAWGKTLASFSARVGTAGQVNAIEVRGWDATQKQPVSGRAERSQAAQAEFSDQGLTQIDRGAGGTSEIVVADAAVANAEDAEARAAAMMQEQLHAQLTGNGTCFGDPAICAGTALDISDVGRFSGQYDVSSATHTIDGSGYMTSFEAVKKQS